MERYSIDAITSNGNMSQRAMLNSSVAAAGNNNPPRPNYPCPYPLKPQSRVASFSTYLPPKDQKQESNVPDSELNIFEAERYFNDVQDRKELNNNVSTMGPSLGRVCVYRNDETSMANPRLSAVSSVDGSSTNYARNFRSGSFHATPTASSEASWNSQTGLLSNPPGSIAVSMKNLRLDDKRKMNRALSNSSSSSSKWFFGRKCPCTGSKSLQVQEDISEHNKSSQVVQLSNTSTGTSFKKQSFSSSAGEDVYIKATMEFEREKAHNNWVKVQEVVPVKDSDDFLPEKRWNRSFSNDTGGGGGGGAGGAFSFPILNAPISATTKANFNGGKPVLMIQQLDDPPRESLEVFQPTEEPISLRKSTDLQRRVLMSFPEESDRRSFNYPGSPKLRPNDDDVMSDASSDLFEIESFSTQSTMFPMYRRRDSLDETSSYDGRRYGGIGTHFRRSLDETTPSIAPTECYEPSEMSIDWSVTTAEGFDRGSVSNFSVAAPSDHEDARFMNNIDTKMSTQSTSNRKGAGLFSCRYEKAVNVGPHPVKRVSLEQHNQVGGGKYGIESGRINPAMSRTMDRNSLQKGNGNKLGVPFARSLSARMSYNQALTTRS
ncbi:protein PHYTOCHROME KINASE SUBSTRATE 4-like isoform X1 [Papaver somniferum]|uniref:protein PHYTOCHROME KINASE SUBSTRATE 4-like isoform X1 n=1 Tax=Papaver somniferum TaxID=3469 RepID=UPI000E700D3D|nr:protein PHYTOCHROME KINASE SUBSTRATE 4-like isoform X1 [Papaver somniferum]XP_026424884.1 protein PHYTOCHROME KINASE SUBSTRATE 4-like isoform X1 [Papaver somniferum]